MIDSGIIVFSIKRFLELLLRYTGLFLWGGWSGAHCIFSDREDRFLVVGLR